MKYLVDNIARRYALSRKVRLEELRHDAVNLQHNTFKNLIYKLSKSKYLKAHGIGPKSTIKDFQHYLPIASYEDLYPHINKMMLGEKDILVPGIVKWFSKSSGTSGAKSKFIPVTKNYMRTGYTRTNWDVVTILHQIDPDIGIFKHKSLLMGGSIKPHPENIKARVGDVSAIMMENMPRFAKPFHTPSFEIALMDDWDTKLELMKTICAEESVITFGGVPTWTLVLFRMMMEYKKVENMLEIWPHARVFLHGGVGFDPYKEEFQKLFPKDDFIFMEAYNASEGYFGLQDRFEEDGMLLLTDNSIFYEFISMSELKSKNPIVLQLEDVEEGVDYALVITTSSGLWRYKIGDVVRFNEVNPFRFKVVGRTEQYINVFGEELMVHNSDEAIARTCEMLNCSVFNYTAAPIYFNNADRIPGHQWLVEFDHLPVNVHLFTEILDGNLKALNSDYEAKRYNDLAMGPPSLSVIPSGSFDSWLKSKSRWSAQVKVPRLSNDRLIIEDILSHLSLSV